MSSKETGYTAGDTVDTDGLMRMRHRAGEHSGRRRDPACSLCRDEMSEATADERRAAITEVAGLWRALSESEIERVLPKAQEYGARDLEVFGAALRCLFDVTERVSNQELACGVYALAKMSRVIGALIDARPSDDSWHDLGVYARMAQIIRSRGEWA